MGLETDRIEGALTSRLSSARRWDGEPFLATNRDEVFEAAGSRYTYAANPLAMKEASGGLQRLALVGMSCQASINGTLQARRVNKYARRIEITLGLLCSKSFAYDGMRQVVTEDYGVPLDDIAKVNIKGRFQLWRRSTGELVEIPLKSCSRPPEGCKLCPDFAAEHADIATGGLGQRDGWTLAVVRTQRGEDWMREAEADGVITVRPGEEGPGGAGPHGQAGRPLRTLAGRADRRPGRRGCSRWCRPAEEAPEPPRSADLQGYGGDVVTFPLARHLRYRPVRDLIRSSPGAVRRRSARSMPWGRGIATDRDEQQRQQRQELEEIRRSFAEMGAAWARCSSRPRPTSRSRPMGGAPATPATPAPEVFQARPRWWWAGLLALLFVAGTASAGSCPGAGTARTRRPSPGDDGHHRTPASTTQATVQGPTVVSVPEDVWTRPSWPTRSFPTSEP